MGLGGSVEVVIKNFLFESVVCVVFFILVLFFSGNYVVFVIYVFFNNFYSF